MNKHMLQMSNITTYKHFNYFQLISMALGQAHEPFTLFEFKPCLQRLDLFRFVVTLNTFITNSSDIPVVR